MREHVAVVAIVFLLGLTASSVLSDGPAAAAPGRSKEIAQLIEQLGSGKWKVRKAATTKLREIGPAALPALKGALNSPDWEVKVRARMILNEIGSMAPQRLALKRANIAQAFRDANYPSVMEASREIVQYENAEMLDWLWLGHGCQLGGKWSDAIEAYKKVASMMDADLDGGPPGPANANEKGRRTGAEEGAMNAGPPARVGPAGWNAAGRKNLINQRTVLMMWIARMERTELQSPAAAAKTLGAAIAYLEASKTDVDYVWLKLLREHPIVLHAAGDLAGAIGAWRKFVETEKLVKHRNVGVKLVDVDLIAADIAARGPGAKLPDVPWIFFLDPKRPSAKLALDDPKIRDRSYRPSYPSKPHWYYAFAPPADKEFDTIEFGCDIEQLKLRYGGHFRCSVVGGPSARRAKDLGSIGWPIQKTKKKQLGRQVVTKMFEIPPGVRLVHIETGTWQGYFNVHEVSAKATFRPVTRNAPPVLGDAWMQTEVHPPNGKLTWGEMKLADQRAYSGIEPGRGSLRYAVPGRPKAIEMDFEVKPGRRYGVFVNLDSPFRWKQSELTLTNSSPIHPSRVSIRRLPVGGYLAVWCGADGKLMASRSKDLADWTDPSPLPFNSIFDNIEPATFRAADGAVWLAFFSNRLCLQSTSTAGYELWITRTRDGRTWAPIRRIEIGSVGGWPLTSPSMLVGPKGKHWVFWRNHAGSADSLEKVRELERFEVPKVGQDTIHLWNPHVVLGGDGLIYMVCDDFGRGIYHLASADGFSWTRPRPIVERQKDGGSQVGNPQIILADGKAALIYEYSGAYITVVRPDGEPVPAGRGIKIASHVAPLAGSRIFRADGGKVFLLAGKDTTWLLQADLNDLLKAVEPVRP